MKKFVVEDVKVGVSDGGMACGPVSGNVIAEVRIHDMEKGTVKYHSLAEVEGTLSFFETDISTYDQQIASDVDDEAFWDMLSEHDSGEFSDYNEFFDNLDELESHDKEHLLVWKYLVYLVRADWDEVERMKKETIGKCLDDFEIPVCDVEQEYQDENREGAVEQASSSREEVLLEEIRSEYEGLQINTGLMELEEGETYDALYSTEEKFSENGNEYKLTFEFWLNDNGEFVSIKWPKCEKLIGDKAVPCAVGEVSAVKIIEMLRYELDSWL